MGSTMRYKLTTMETVTLVNQGNINLHPATEIMKYWGLNVPKIGINSTTMETVTTWNTTVLTESKLTPLKM